MIRPALLITTLLATLNLYAHDNYEITLEILEKRKGFSAVLEMAQSTAVAATDPNPSNGFLFEPEEFPNWEGKFLQSAPELIQILNTEGKLQIQSVQASLSREDDVVISYEIDPSEDDSPLRLSAPILNRFPPEGFGVRVTFRDKSGHWYPPFMIFIDKTTVDLPSQ